MTISALARNTALPGALLALLTVMPVPAAGSRQATPPAPRGTRPPTATPQPQAPPPPSMVQVVPLEDDRGARDTRDRLRRVLDQYPPSVRQVLRLDTSLLSRPDYLATYPTLAAFLEQHPEVAHNPRYFVGDPDGPSGDERAPDARIEAVRAWRNFAEMVPVVAIVFIITSALAGVIRTLTDQHRWRRATRMQMDMQNKIIDRFARPEELLTYVQSPAGRSLVEMQPPAAPVAAARAWDAPIARIFWPLQAGIVLSAAGVGLLFVGRRVQFEELGQPLAGAGILAIAVGLGFIVSAAVSFIISHRLGLVTPQGPPAFRRETPGP